MGCQMLTLVQCLSSCDDADAFDDFFAKMLSIVALVIDLTESYRFVASYSTIAFVRHRVRLAHRLSLLYTIEMII